VIESTLPLHYGKKIEALLLRLAIFTFLEKRMTYVVREHDEIWEEKAGRCRIRASAFPDHRQVTEPTSAENPERAAVLHTLFQSHFIFTQSPGN
jgi:hypothetical protein